MSYSLNSLPLFFPSMIVGATMMLEGFLIVILRKHIVPLPTRILYWISLGLFGKEKTSQSFAGKDTPRNLRTYAFFALFLGVCLIISSFIYLNSMLAA